MEESKAPDFVLPAVGSVWRLPPPHSCRATVSVVDVGTGTADVILASSGEDVDEVPLTVLQPLLPCEDAAVLDAADVETLMAFGKELFMLGDADAACEVYERALSLGGGGGGVAAPDITVGSRVLVRGSAAGVVACVDDGTVDVMLDDGDDADGVPVSEVSVIGDGSGVSGEDGGSAALHGGLQLNAARCHFKCERFEAAVEHLDAAVAILTEPTKLEAAYFLRAKCHLRRLNLKAAAADAKRLQATNPKQARTLLQSVSQAKTRQAKSNRKLAANVAQWLEAATAGVDWSTGGKPAAGAGAGQE